MSILTGNLNGVHSMYNNKLSRLAITIGNKNCTIYNHCIFIAMFEILTELVALASPVQLFAEQCPLPHGSC